MIEICAGLYLIAAVITTGFALLNDGGYKSIIFGLVWPLFWFGGFWVRNKMDE